MLSLHAFVSIYSGAALYSNPHSPTFLDRQRRLGGKVEYITLQSLALLKLPSSIIGCFHQVFDKNGWKFHYDIVHKYGGVVRLPMLLGVRKVQFNAVMQCGLVTSCSQQEELYVFDPLALHHVLVKDQYTYEETSMFITYVYSITSQCRSVSSRYIQDQFASIRY